MLSEPQFETDVAGRLRDAVKDVFAVQDITAGTAQSGVIVGQREPKQAVRLRGDLLMSAEEAYNIVSSRFRNLGYTTLFRRDRGTDVILAMPGELPTSEARPLLAGGLFIATVLSALYAGMQMAGPEVIADGLQFWDILHGWPFALGLLSVLVAHELGHYFVARYSGAAVSLPYFIPMPVGPFGTLGAVINMKAPPANRRQLLAIAAAGPIAGFVLAVPILIIGLSLSEVGPMPPGGYYLEGNSLLYAALKFIMFGRFLPSGGIDVSLHQMAFAGWAGLLVTGLNLLPVGTLDGGHIMYALAGDKARRLTWPIIGLMLALSLIWNGWLLWAALLFFFGRYHAVPLNDITQLQGAGRAIAIAVIIIFILTFVPIPLTVVQ
ncbi:MAG: site-2 protease family protein [Anaerolineae bacterium]